MANYSENNIAEMNFIALSYCSVSQYCERNMGLFSIASHITIAIISLLYFFLSLWPLRAGKTDIYFAIVCKATTIEEQQRKESMKQSKKL